MARKDSALSAVSSAAVDPWQHSFSKSLGFMSKILHLQSRRRTLTRYNSGLSLPQVRAMLMPCLAFLLASQLFIGAVASLKDGVWDDALLIANLIFLQVQSVAPSFAFGIKFHKCAQVRQSDLLNPALSRKSCLLMLFVSS